MVMARTITNGTLDTYTEELARQARTRDGVPEGIAWYARDVTRRNLTHLDVGSLQGAERRRVASYYRGVLRREAARSSVPGAREYRIRAMAASVAADLRASGADGERVAREVAAWLASFPGAA